jgi:hypothetical protein
LKIILAILLSVLLSVGFFVRPWSPPGDGQAAKEIGRTTEKELKVVLSSSFGDVEIEKGDREKIILLESDPSEENSSRFSMDYEIRNRIGYADLILGEGEAPDDKATGFRIKDLQGGKWSLKLSDAVPISFDLKLGVGKGLFDLSGLQVKDFNLSTGATDVHLGFDEPNKSKIENLSIESGLSKFEGSNLCNANFKHLRFQGGVGTYRLDFGGKLSNEVDVDISLGMGLMTLYIPPGIGAKVHHEKNWVSHVEYPDDFHATDENEYTSDNYNSSTPRLNIRLDSGVGSVKIRR